MNCDDSERKVSYFQILPFTIGTYFFQTKYPKLLLYKQRVYVHNKICHTRTPIDSLSNPCTRNLMHAYFANRGHLGLIYTKQECIPIGCAPFAAVAVGGGGVSVPVHAGGVCPSAYWDMSAWGRGVCPSACWDMSACGRGVCPSACWDVSPGACLPQCMLGYTPYPREQNDRCL